MTVRRCFLVTILESDGAKQSYERIDLQNVFWGVELAVTFQPLPQQRTLVLGRELRARVIDGYPEGSRAYFPHMKCNAAGGTAASAKPFSVV